MQYLDGVWLINEGYQVSFAQQIYDARIEQGPQGQQLTLYAPFQKVENEGEVLNNGLLTVEISSPLEDIIRVRQYHHLGTVKTRPAFQCRQETVPVEISQDGPTWRFRSGKATLVIQAGPPVSWRFCYADETRTQIKPRGQVYLTDPQGQPHSATRLSLEVGEQIYGLGERFSALIKNGQAVDTWNRDGGTGTTQAYKCIPFYISSRSYGVLADSPDRVSFEIASEKVSDVQFSVPGEELSYCFIGGADMKAVLSRYCDLTGHPARLPAWSFGLWLSTSFLTDYDEKTVLDFVDGMAQRDIPLEVFHFDCRWMKSFEWCNFLWDKSKFPDPVRMLRRLHEKGLKVCVWINPYIGQKSPLFKEGLEKGYFIKRPDGSVWQWDLWVAGMGIVDFTNPEAVRWYQGLLKQLTDMGVDCFKTDFGERIPTDCVYYDGSDPQRMHNYYSYLYNQTVFELLREQKGDGQAVLFARSATVGGQQFPVHWGGDCTAEYVSMAESLRAGLSFGLSGFGYWSHDIGGFEDGCEPDLYRRWTQFGLLSSHSRYHGSGMYKVPWLYGQEAVDNTRLYTKLKLKLMPYLMQTASAAWQQGLPMLRAMVLEFQEDENCRTLDRQYMLGSQLLVAPVFSSDSRVSFYLPGPGVWTHLLTGERLQGGRWYSRYCAADWLPLYVRPGSILLLGHESRHPDYDYTVGSELHVYADPAVCAAEITVVNSVGASCGQVAYTLQDQQLVLKQSGLAQCQLCLHDAEHGGIYGAYEYLRFWQEQDSPQSTGRSWTYRGPVSV
ncbi:MAG: alpha-xylosidase [Oscillospiraceae bacterium]|nr:alpha-xylosidase [Oscillospiraceae bacterium]